MAQDWVHDAIFPYKLPFFGETDSVFRGKTGQNYTKAFSVAVLLYFIDQKSRERISTEREIEIWIKHTEKSRDERQKKEC